MVFGHCSLLMDAEEDCLLDEKLGILLNSQNQQRSKILSAEQQYLADNWTYQFILIF